MSRSAEVGYLFSQQSRSRPSWCLIVLGAKAVTVAAKSMPPRALREIRLEVILYDGILGSRKHDGSRRIGSYLYRLLDYRICRPCAFGALALEAVAEEVMVWIKSTYGAACGRLGNAFQQEIEKRQML